jgi:hypothetical protein
VQAPYPSAPYQPAQYVPQAQPDRVSRWWAAAPLLSGGFLAFLPFLRIASVKRRAKDWIVFGGYLAADLLVLALANTSHRHSAGGAVLNVLAFSLLTGGTVHALIALRSLPAPVPPPSLGPPIAAHPGYDPVSAARARIARREEARQLADRDPVLARELKIGRPDQPRQYDDGGLVDVNHVPAAVLTQHLQLTPDESQAVLAAREQLGRFTSPEEFSIYAQLAPAKVDEVRDLLWFG